MNFCKVYFTENNNKKKIPDRTNYNYLLLKGIDSTDKSWSVKKIQVSGIKIWFNFINYLANF